MGTDTGVGKSRVLELLTAGLRALGRRVWLYKPVACGDWRDGQAEDGRRLAPLVGDGQEPASACPHQWPEACSPHLAAALTGDRLTLAELLDEYRQLATTTADLLVEGAGGIRAPLTSDDGDIVAFATATGLPAVLVTRPHLGTLNHTRLSVEVLQQAGIRVLGLVINTHEAIPSCHATDTAADELQRLTGLPILATLPFQADSTVAEPLASAVLRQACAASTR